MESRVVSKNFDVQRVSLLSHDFSKHTGLQFDALRQLALRVSARNTGQVKFINPGAQLTSKFELATGSYDGKTIDEIFDTLDTPGTWIAIYEAQTDPAFRRVVEEVIDSTRHLLTGLDSKIFDIDAYIFISRAPSLTPFHIDREHNFLLQIHGAKRLSVWDPDDRQAVSETAVEEWIVEQTLKHVTFSEDKITHAAFDGQLNAGQGLFMPSTSAHMTRTETASTTDPVSATVGFVFYTAATRKRANIYAMNTVLRRLGFEPGPPGRNAVIDTLKYFAGYCAIRLLVLLGKLDMPRGL